MTDKPNMKWILLLLTFSISLQAEDDQLYQEVLKRHAESGHINSKDIDKQKFYYDQDKEFQDEFNEKIRGIASTLKAPKDVIELDNPAIEIPVK